MKTGWKTSEFWITLATKGLALLAVAGAISTADENRLAQTATTAIVAVFSILAAAKVIVAYVQGRCTVKSSSTSVVLILGLLLPGIATAQVRTRQPCQCGRSCVVQPTCLFGCRCGQNAGKTDPAMMALLQQIASQQQQILAMLQHQLNQSPAPLPAPQFIVLGPQQQIPLGGRPRQDIPLGGPPRQDIPLGGPPKQDIPLGSPPKQDLPLGIPPRQDIPLGPIPKANGTVAPQRYTQIYFWQPASR